MNAMRASSGRNGLIGLLLCVLAVVAILVPGIGFIRSVTDGGVVLKNGPTTVTLPAHRQYGIYFNDTDNSGYEERCSITDGGRRVAISSPGWSLGSETEALELVFDTGSGHLVISCTSTAEGMRARPVPDLAGMLIGAGVGSLLGLVGFVFLVVIFLDGLTARREKRRREEEERDFPGEPPAE